MPTYEYQCEKCGLFETVQKITENALERCPSCNGKVKRLLSAAPFHLKGSGWYKTDYSSSSSSSSADAKSAKDERKGMESGGSEASKAKDSSTAAGGAGSSGSAASSSGSSSGAKD